MGSMTRRRHGWRGPRRGPAREVRPARPRAGVAVALVGLVAVLACALPAAAAAGTLEAGTPGHPFSKVITNLSDKNADGLAIVGTSNQSLTLKRCVLWTAGDGSPASGTWGSAQWLSNGSRLVCGGGAVQEVGVNGTTTWTYPTGGAGVDPTWAWEFGQGGHTYVLICDELSRSVFAVDRGSDAVVWTCSDIADPVCARYVGTSGTVLIADDDPAAPEVIEVSFDPGSSPQTIWSYGGTSGTGFDQVMGPTDVYRESDGSTLIADAAADRVIRVGPGSQDVSWQYPAAGSESGTLNDPMGVGVEQDDVMIADTGHGRVIEVDPGSDAVVWSSADLGSSAPALSVPRVAERVTGSAPSGLQGDSTTVDGGLLVCDQGGQDLALIGNTTGAQVDTKSFRLASGGKQAHLLRLRLDASVPTATHTELYYTPSDGVQRGPFGRGVISVRSVVTTRVSFVLALNSDDLWLTPTVKDIVLTYTAGETKAKTLGNGGATGGNGTASGAGTGTGSGVGGSGNGSGVGAGQGTSADLGGSGSAGSSGSTAQSGGANVVVPAGAQVATTGGAATAGTITGVPVNVGNLSGGALGGGGQPAAPRLGPRRRPARGRRGGVRRLPAALPVVRGASPSAPPRQPRADGRRGRVDRGGGAPGAVAEGRPVGRSRPPRVVAPTERYGAPGSSVRPHASFRASAVRLTSSAVFR